MTPTQYTRVGPAACADVDLLSLLTQDELAARRLLATFGDLAGVVAASPAALAAHLPTARAARLHAAFAVARRALEAPPPRPRVQGVDDALAWLRPRLSGLAHEELHALFLDGRGGLLSVQRMSSGARDHTVFDPRQVLGEALRIGASAVIVGHNHPSGDPAPSKEDLVATRRLVEGGRLVGVEVRDHLVIGADRYASLASRGEI